jgi:hypothetical protein
MLKLPPASQDVTDNRMNAHVITEDGMAAVVTEMGN